MAKLLSQLRDERDASRAERHRDEMWIWGEELLKQQQFEEYKAELKLKELKLERSFTLTAQNGTPGEYDGGGADEAS